MSVNSLQRHMYMNTHFPRPIRLTFYFFFITHMLEEGSPSVQDSFILHPIVIKKKKRMLRLLLEWATWSSPASGQVNLQAVVHVNGAESLFLWCQLLLHAAPHLVLENTPVPHSFSSNLDRAPTRTGERKSSPSCRLDVEDSPLWDLGKKKKKMKEKKYQERKFGVSGVLVMIVCGNPASVLSSLNTHCIKMYTLTHTHMHTHPHTDSDRELG